MRKLFALFFLLMVIVFSSCSENPVNPVQGEIILYQKSGLVDSIVGTCSTFLVRTTELDTIDFTQFKNLKIYTDAFTDGDLSTLDIFRIVSDTAVNIYSLSGSGQINSANGGIINSPRDKNKYFLRLKLFSSVCTGQYFHLKLRDFRISGIK